MATKSGGQSSGSNYRSAKTGEYVKQGYAEKHPATTVKERRDPPPKSKSR